MNGSFESTGMYGGMYDAYRQPEATTEPMRPMSADVAAKVVQNVEATQFSQRRLKKGNEPAVDVMDADLAAFNGGLGH
jgi:hypothetical protein